LYTFDADGDSGKASCIESCAQEFPAYLAAGDAIASGDWSLVARGSKQRQWVYRGHPLYYYNGVDPVPDAVASKDKPTDFLNDRASLFLAAAMDPSSELYSPKRGWRRAAFKPEETTSVPSGIVLRSNAAASGYGFVDQGTGMPLYVLRTEPKNPTEWTPTYAPDLAHAVGDFSIMVKADGRKQWAYKGQALYSYRGDYGGDDLNGLLAQSDARPALAYRDFLPSSVRIQIVPMRGALMVTPKGLSVYTETRYNDYGSTNVPGEFRPSYDEARAVGTRGCVADCLGMWKPLLASAHDQASGFWEIDRRPDGTRQWAYKGCALYTYTGDKSPGDIEGNDRTVIVYGDPQGKIDLSLTGGDRGPNVRKYAGSGLYWHLVSFYD
jgi:predicted lipoprotein with Yx(FWY)xxD motif